MTKSCKSMTYKSKNRTKNGKKRTSWQVHILCILIIKIHRLENPWLFHDFCHFLTNFMTIPGLENKYHFPRLSQDFSWSQPQGGTDLEIGYGDVRPWRPPFHASPAARKGPISSKRVSSQDPLLRKFGNFSLYSLNFHPNFSSQAPKFGNFQLTSLKFGNFQLTSPQIWKFSAHKPPFSEANISSQAPHYGNPGRTPFAFSKPDVQQISFMYKIKIRGPSMDPWGTPHWISSFLGFPVFLDSSHFMLR